MCYSATRVQGPELVSSPWERVVQRWAEAEPGLRHYIEKRVEEGTAG